MTTDGDGYKCPLSKFICFFVALTIFLMIFEIITTSRNIAVAFNIPNQYVGIYFSKIYAFNNFCTFVGTGIEIAIYYIVGQINSECNDTVRKYISVVFTSFMFVTRLLFVILLYKSKSKAFHFYILFCVEGFIFGFVQITFFGIAGEFSPSGTLGINFSSFLTFLIQTFLDLFMRSNPLKMIKIHSIICLCLTFLSLGLWSYFVFKLKDETSSSSCGGSSSTDSSGSGGSDGQIISTFLMFHIPSFFKDFLFPAILPYGLLELNKCHIINKLIPFCILSGSMTIYILNEYEPNFKKWSSPHYYDLIWLFLIPIITLFFLSLLAIHSKKRFFRLIVNSQWRVMLMTLSLIVSHTFFDSTTYVGVANYVFTSGKDQISSRMGIMLGHNLSCIIFRYLFCKISVGYNDIRVRSGYVLPNFKPVRGLNDKFGFWFGNTFTHAWKDIVNDFRFNIKKYL